MFGPGLEMGPPMLDRALGQMSQIRYSGPESLRSTTRENEEMPHADYEHWKSPATDEVFLMPRWLHDDNLAHCILLSGRIALIKRLPRQAVVGEVGTLFGDFAKQIVRITEPREFHIFDLSFRLFDYGSFESDVLLGRVILHEGDSSTQMSKLSETLFDWIFFDADPSFEGVVRDIREENSVNKAEWIFSI